MRRSMPHLCPSFTTVFFVILCVSSCTPSPVLAQSGKKGNGGGNSAPPQPLYKVDLFAKPDGAYMFSTITPFINEELQVAGGYVTQNSDGTFYYSNVFFYDPLIHAGQAIDLNSVVQGLPEGFTIKTVCGMNDRGLIAVEIRPLENLFPTVLPPTDPNFLALAGLVDTTNGYQFYALPDLGSNMILPRELNNSGDVVLVGPGTDPGSHTTYIASFDATQGNWQISASYPDFAGYGMSERLESGDLFLVGATGGVTTRINVTNPGVGEIRLTPVQIDKNTTYTFNGPAGGRKVNAWGEFLGRLKSTTETTRRGQTTTSSFWMNYLCTQTWEEHNTSYAQSLNDDLDFTAGGLSSAPTPLLIHRDIGGPIDLLTVIDKSTAPEIDWEAPNLVLTNLSMTNRWVTDDGDPTNDLPVIMGFDQYTLENQYLLNTRYAFMLIPIAR